MKKWIFMCLVVLFSCVACNFAMRDGAKTAALKADMPNMVKLSNGEVVYDLRGEWDVTSEVSHYRTYSGVMDIKQDEDRFVGTLQSGDYQDLGTWEKLRGRLKGAEVVNIYFNTSYGWMLSIGEIADGGKVMTIISEMPENIEVFSILRRRQM